MKQIEVRTKGVMIRNAGFAVLFSGSIVPFLIKKLVDSNLVVLALMLLHLLVGAFLMIAGVEIVRRERSNPGYKAPVNLFRVLKLWQILLMVSAASFFGAVIFSLLEVRWLVIVFLLGNIGCASAAAVIGIIRRKKNKPEFIPAGGGKLIRAVQTPSGSPPVCLNCGKALSAFEIRSLDGKKYCIPCYLKVSAERTENDRTIVLNAVQTKCSCCNRPFPKSSLHIIYSRSLCDECFQKEYSKDLP